MDLQRDNEDLSTTKLFTRSALSSPTTDKEKSKTINNNKWTPLLVVAAIATTCGSSLSVGYNIGVVNSPAEIIKEFCRESVYTKYNIVLSENEINILWSAVVSIFLVGGATGSLGGSWFADKIGRKGAMIIGNVLSVIAGIFFIITKTTNSVEILIAARLIVGLSSGLTTCVTPMYLTEIAPTELRGAMGVMCPLGVTFGVLLGQIMSLTEVLGTKEHWHVLLGFYIILVITSSIVFPFLPESPKYLYVVKKQYATAITELKRLRKAEEQNLLGEIRELKNEEEDEISTDSEWTMWKVLCDKTLLLPLLLVCSLQAGQQFSGINAVFYYSVSIFKTAGLNETKSQYATIGAGCINFLMAVISIPVMSRFNRRSVIQISCFTAFIFLIILGIAITYMATITWMPYISIVGVLGYVLCYGIGLGPIPYFIGSELFEVGPRPSAMALGSMANWGGNFFIGMTFPTLQAVIGPSSFYIFALITALLLLFVRKYLPETRGRDVTEIAYLCRSGLASKPLWIAESNNV